MLKRISILLSSLLLLWACGEDNNTPQEQLPTGFDFNLVTILEEAEPEQDGWRRITLCFKDKSDNQLILSAPSWHTYLETGWYEIIQDQITPAVGKLKAGITLLSIRGEAVKVTGGTIAVSKWNYEYDIIFNLETEKGKFTGLADNKKIYFDTQKYSSLWRRLG